MAQKHVTAYGGTIVGYIVEVHHETHGTYTRTFDGRRDGAKARRDAAALIEDCNVWGRSYTLTTLFADATRRTGGSL